MGIQLRDAEYFAVVAEQRSIGRAADALGLSQPALSKSLRRLEESLDAKVVKRTPKGVELTAVGNALLSQMQRLRLTLDDIYREAADLGSGRAGHLRVATVPGFDLEVVPAVCEALLKEAPKMTMKITVDDRNAALAGLRNGTLDLAVASLRSPKPDDLVEEHLHDEPFVVYASTNHRLAQRKQMSLADLAGERWALTNIDGPAARHLNQAFADAGLPPLKVAVEAASLPVKFRLVARAHLLAFGSRRSIRYAAAHLPVAELPVRGFRYNSRIGLFHRKDAYLSPAARRFIEILKTTVKKIAAAKQ